MQGLAADAPRLAVPTDLQAAAFDALPLGAVLVTADGTVLVGNGTFRSMVGLNAVALAGAPVAAFFSPDGPRDHQQLLTAARVGAQQTVPGALATPAGPVRVTATSTPLPAGSEGATLLVAFLVEPAAGSLAASADGTARQGELVLSAAQSRARFEQSAVAMALLDTRGAFLSVNSAMSRLLGRKPDELQGFPLLSMSRPEDARRSGTVERVASGDVDACQLELVITRAPGDELVALADVTCVRSEQGVSAGAALSLHDLTELRASEQRRVQQGAFFATMGRLAGDLALVADQAGHLVYVSPGANRVLGYEPEALMGLEGWDFVHPDDVPASQAIYGAVVADGRTRSMELRVRAADGTWRWIEETVTNMLDEPVGGLVCNLRDIHEQKLAQQQLEQSEAKFRAIAEAADQGIWAATADGTTLFVNARMAALLGRPLQDLYDLPADAFVEPGLVVERRRLRAERGPEGYEVRYQHADLGERIFWISAAPFPAPDGSIIGSVAMVSDVTENRRTERELQRMALYDSLTGIANRALFLDRLEHSLNQPHSTAAVLLIDLDFFKLVNDSRGHQVGDELLVTVAQALVGTVRPQDTVARLGGDEFVVLTEDLTQAQALDLGQRILLALSTLAGPGGEEHSVSASVGLAMGPGSAGDVLRYADTAMYAAKGDGRGRIRAFDPALAHEAEERYALSSDLRQAFLEDTLDMAYQPILDLATGAVIGVEALVRWHHPTRGQIPADQLVSVAELTGLSYQLDRWAIQRALRDAGRMRSAGTMPLSAYVAINLTALNLDNQGLEALLVTATAATGLHPSCVVLEITESAVMLDTGASIRLLQRLCDRGYRIALDDFGTGHSSLAYLRDLPVTSLKIDRSFIARITEDSDSLAIAASIIDLGRRVGLTTVAEGVETEQQAALLRKLGCSSAQGWLWSAATLPADLAHSRGWTVPFNLPDAAHSTTPRGWRREKPRAGSEHGLNHLLWLHEQGASLVTIAAALNRSGYATPEGMRWHSTSVARTLAQVAHERKAERGRAGS